MRPNRPGKSPHRGGAGYQERQMFGILQGLSGAQANHAGWPLFDEKDVSFPGFRKEW
jgi:hypothetical protein